MTAFHIDHDVTNHVTQSLHNYGHHAWTARDLGLEKAHDGVQLMAAAQQQRVLVSHNWKDFRLLHRTWLHWTEVWQIPLQHAGILIVPQRLWTPLE
ncbi:MAG: DUF5615 family PIN-like protein, partial [Chloroflexota bacterium]